MATSIMIRTAAAAAAALAAALAPPAGEARAEAAPAGGAGDPGAYLVGVRAHAVGDFATALDSFREALRADPGSGQLRRRAFLAALSAGDFGEMAGLAASIAGDGAAAGLVRVVVVSGLVRRGELAAAEGMLAGPGGDAVWALVRHGLLAWVKGAAGRTDQALTELDAAGPGGRRALHDLMAALVSERVRRDRQALGYYRRAGGRGGRPSAHLALRLGAFHERAGDAAAARGVYAAFPAGADGAVVVRRALARMERGGPPPPPVAGAAEGAAAMFHEIAGDALSPRSPRLALAYARLATWLDPGLHLARVRVAAALELMGRDADALAALRGVPPGSPPDEAARLGEARILWRLGRKGEAEALLGGLAGRAAVRVDALTELGDLHRIDGAYTAAIDAYARAIGSLSGPPGDGRWMLYYKRGIAYERAKRWDLAEGDLERALGLRPDQPDLLNYLAYSWADQGVNLERARGMLERAVALRPSAGHIVDSLGWALYRLGEFAAAVAQLERAVSLLPQDPIVNDHLGDAYWRVGRHREARVQWRRALSLGPEPEAVPAIEGKIRDGLGAPGAPGAGERDS